MRLPCLSLSQPWCEMVLHPAIDKDVENRPWNCFKRGTFLLHAAQGMRGVQYREALKYAADLLGHSIDTGAGVRYLPSTRATPVDEVPISFPDPRELSRGGLVGAAQLLDVVPPEKWNHSRRWHMAEFQGRPQYGLLLGNRVRLPFRALNGRQRWFYVELTADEERVLREAGML